ncbi:hypothetical protein DQK91_18665 [Oceanidesulfovibrio marinus]|uniref:Uncharacterized protein n=1 Tax=Oceanidesulfovibrio marinus TaxID=370038 RepID=A0A6P1ZBM4_9BACT|nr:hypothetical protein DQK91_18665 [Oceanidesulfovibrio marinus]
MVLQAACARTGMNPFIHSVEQQARVGMGRVAKHVLGRTGLHEHAAKHDRYLVGQGPDRGQIVGDIEVGHAVPFLELVELAENLGLDRAVQRGHGLVRDDQLRLQRHGPRQADALSLPAGHLVRMPG